MSTDEAFAVTRVAGDAIDGAKGIFEEILIGVVGTSHGDVLPVGNTTIETPGCEEVLPRVALESDQTSDRAPRS